MWLGSFSLVSALEAVSGVEYLDSLPVKRLASLTSPSGQHANNPSVTKNEKTK